MDHDELMQHLELEVDPDVFSFTSDKADVMYAYHEGDTPVAVGAGAGTGKTTALTKAVGEAVLRQCEPSPGESERNPFDDILVMTFMRDAANELKTTIKEVLRDHQAAAGYDLETDIWRWVETESHINTINAFTMELLREVAADAHVDPGFEIRDELETQELLGEVRATLEEDEDLADALKFLEAELGDDDPSPITLIYNIHQKLREFGDDFEDPATALVSRVRDDLHNGQERPLKPDNIRNIVQSLTGNLPDPDELDSDNVAAIDATYDHNITYAEAVGDLVEAFESTYDELTRRQGLLTYTDTTYLVLQYLESEDGRDFVNSLRTRFSHVFVDEFQDTSYAQCRILSHVLGTHEEDTPAERPKLMIIGDIKQAIYGWRSADPAIFAEILQRGGTAEDPDPYLGIATWTVQDLSSNFRSHPHLVRAANGLFDDVFNHPGRGAISDFTVPYHDLNPALADDDEDSDSSEADSDTDTADPHLHVLPLGADTADGWRRAEPDQIASTIRGVVDDGTLTIEEDGEERPIQPGDVTMLFRASSRFREFRDALDRYGLQNAVVAESGLFSADEVSFVIDVLDWFANPHSKDSLLRILRSPVTALDDRTLRFIASKGHDPTRALDEWPDGRLPSGDKKRLSTLVDLRSDLRWDREDSKATLIQKIIQHTGIETVLLTGSDPRKRYGNLSMLVEVVRDWEEDELLPYREFVDRLKEYRQMARSGSEQFEVAQVADESAAETVKLRTVHSAKGLEFNLVVIADMMQGDFASPLSDKFVPVEDDNGERSIALQPREYEQQISFNTGPGSTWITNDDTSTLWLSESRDNAGALQYPHPYNTALTGQFAEYWRLLYVASTRAADHLVLPLGDDYHGSKKWSWGAAMLDHFQPDAGWPDAGDETVDAEWLQHTGIRRHQDDSGPASIPVSCGEFPTADELAASPIGIDLFESDTERSDADGTSEADDTGEWEGVGFAPRTLRPSTLYHLINCPRRYQYRALQDITDSHGESPEGTNNPPGISASVWGTMVHDALEDYHKDLREGVLNDPESRFEQRLADDLNDDAAERIRGIVETYQTTTQTGDEIVSADPLLPEYHLSAQHPSEPTVHISGYVDLLYQTDGEWHIADFKTGDPPDEDADLLSQYRWQLATYVWLLKEEYGIEVADARLVYVNSGDEKSLDLEWDLLSDYLRKLPDRLEIESEGGLPLKPSPDPATNAPDSLPLDSRCGACPYTEICPVWQD